MGNSCGVVQSLEKMPEGDSARRFQSVLVGWKYSDTHGSISSELLDFEALRKVSSRACYGLVLVAPRDGTEGRGSGQTPNTDKSDSASGALSKLLTSVIDNLTPRGLNSEWRVCDASRSTAFYCHTYLWVGRRSSAECRAFGVAEMMQQCRGFVEAESKLQKIYEGGSRFLSEMFRMDAELADFEQSVHLIRQRFEQSVADGKAEWRDRRYRLFSRQELAPVKQVKRRGTLRSTVMTKHGSESGESSSSSDESSSDDSSEESSSSSEDEDEDDSSPGCLVTEPPALSAKIVESPMEGDEFSGGLLSEFNLADDGGPEPPVDEPVPTDDAGHGVRIRFFDVRISEITPQLFLGSATGARKRKWLQARGVTHILNCASMILKNWWPDDFEYMSLYLLDGKREDVLCLVYYVLEWIDQAIESGGKVFVHCQQGVSRSTTMVVLYLMWKWRKNYREVNGLVKDCRNVASPNAGFIVQLLMWEKRLFTPISKPRLLLMLPQSTYQPDLIVPKLTTVKNPMTLMSNEVYLLHCPERLWIWTGKSAPESHLEAAKRLAPLMMKFENAPSNLVVIGEGEETAQFWLDLYGGEKPSPRLATTPRRGSSPQTLSRQTPAKMTTGIALPVSSPVEAKRPGSPVKLKLNLGTITAQAPSRPKLGLNLGAVQKHASLEERPPSPSSSSSSSESETSEATEDSESSGDESPNKADDSASRIELVDVKTKPVFSTKLRLSDLQPVQRVEGPISPLHNPSLRHSLGLPSSPKRVPSLTLEQAKRSLELSAIGGSEEKPSAKRLSLDKSSDSSARSSLSPTKKRGSLSADSSSSASVSPGSSAVSIRMSPQVALVAKPIPSFELDTGSPHLGALLNNLFLGDDRVAEDEALLSRFEISDVVNVAGGKVAKATNVKTKTFFCDGDIGCLMYLILARIREGKRTVLQGPKGNDWATAFAIGYVMWSYSQSLGEAERALRGRTALLEPLSDSTRAELALLEERLSGLFLTSSLRVYQVVKQSAKAPTLQVAKQIAHPNKSLLKPTEVVIIHAEGSLFLWSGKQHKYNTLVAAKKIVAQMCEFEGIQQEVELLSQGKESNFFWKLLDSCNLASM